MTDIPHTPEPEPDVEWPEPQPDPDEQPSEPWAKDDDPERGDESSGTDSEADT